MNTAIVTQFLVWIEDAYPAVMESGLSKEQQDELDILLRKADLRPFTRFDSCDIPILELPAGPGVPRFDRQTAQLFQSHLQRLRRVHQEKLVIQSRSHTLQAIVDQYRVGIALINNQLQCFYKNPFLLQLCNNSEHYNSDGNDIRFKEAKAQKEFNDALRTCCDMFLDRKVSGAFFRTIELGGHADMTHFKNQLILHAHPLENNNLDLLYNQVCGVVLIDDLSQPSQRDCSHISEHFKLSNKETEVLEKLTEGLNAKEIAENLNRSIATIKTHTRNVFQKLEVNSQVELIAKVMDLNFCSALASV
jgi:DNA-binding CsgD family transcriptional regulator